MGVSNLGVRYAGYLGKGGREGYGRRGGGKIIEGQRHGGQLPASVANQGMRASN